MAQRVFIKVVGFSDDERHALNTVFRLSEQCRTMYQLWTPEAPEPARLALLDSQSWEARLEAESGVDHPVPFLWVGAQPPARAWRSLPRPLAWPEVIQALDALFGLDAGVDLDLDLDLDEVASTGGGLSHKRALIVSADREERLYLRARLALAQLTLADEAESGSLALELARDRQYDVALVACALPDLDAWALLRQLRHGRHPVAHVAMMRARRTLAERVRAWLAGAETVLDQPPHPARFKAWLAGLH